MSKHTQEPWKINTDEAHDGWSIITNKSGSIIANVNGKTGPELIGGMPVDRVMPAEDNARRIVACVNACSGIRTEALEHRAHMLNAHDDTIYELTRQRDELLAALERTINASAVSMSHSEYVTALDEANAVLTKAKGGAVNHFPEVTKMVPDGWKLVPVVATKAMCSAWDSAPCNNEDDAVNLECAYSAMLAAAPKLEGGAA